MAKKTKKTAKRKAPARRAANTAKKKTASKVPRKTVKPIPDGYHTLTPAFGAKTRLRMDGPDGSAAHAELVIGDSTFMIGTAKEPLSDKFYGDHSGTVTRPPLARVDALGGRNRRWAKRALATGRPPRNDAQSR